MITRETAKKVGRRLLNNIWFHLVANTAFFCLMVALLPFFFETDDDSTMCLIANGVLSGKPDGHLVFINALYGWVVAGLYMISRSVEWYTLLMSGWQILAMTIVSYLISKDQSMHRWLRAGVLTVFYVLWVKLIVLFQFTSTSGLLAFSGCLALLQKDTRWRIAGVVAIAIASLLRFESAVLIGILFAPYLIYRWNQEKRLGYWLIGVTILCVGLRAADTLCYQSQEWKEYRVFNIIRGRINDNPNSALMTQELLPEGISIEDYEMFRLFEGDPSIFTLPVVREIYRNMGHAMTMQQIGYNVTHLPDYWKPFIVFCIGMILIISTHKVKKMRIVAGCMLALYVGIWYTMGALALIKERVVLCMAMPMLYMTFYGNAHLLEEDLSDSKKKWVAVALSVMLLVVAWSWGAHTQRQVSGRQETMEEHAAYINQAIDATVQNEPEAQLYMLYVPGIYESPWRFKDATYRAVGLGWLTGIPFQKGVLDSFDDFLNSKLRYLCSVEQPPQHILESIQRNYDPNARMVVEYENEKYAVFKFVSDEQ